MPFAHLVRVGTLYPFLEVLRSAGCPFERHLEHYNLLRHVYEDEPEEYVPLSCALNFLERTARSEGIEDLGLLAGSCGTVDSMGAYGQAILKQPIVFKALRCAVELGRKYNTSLSLRLEREGQSVLYLRRFELSSEVGLRHAEHFAQALTLAALNSWSGVNWRPSEMGFQSRTSTGFDLESKLQVRAVLGQRESSIRIPGWLLAKRLRPGKLGDFEHCPLDQAPLHWVEALRVTIKALLYEECAGIRSTAEAAGMSVRSLQRCLLAEGYTYSGLVDEVRFSIAVSLMKDPDRKMIDIALDLGYESPGSFTRAFRRWSGFSPQEFRTLSLGADLETSRRRLA